MNKKITIFDYLDWRGDLTFVHSPFNEIDALILSVFAYLNYSFLPENGIKFFKDAVEEINLLPDEIKFDGMSFLMPSVVKFANLAAATPRFREIGVFDYVDITDEEQEIQFAAITFLLPDHTAFLAFRGTDNTLVGWKEDFNMSFTYGVPAQIEAARYAQEVSWKLNLPLRMGGHSKGGNLAVWAAAHLPSEQKEQLIQIYNNDGPGFLENFLKEPCYLEIRDRILSFVPESSIVGVLMAHDEYQTISSSNSMIMQHDPFSWLLLGTHFLQHNERSRSARRLEEYLNSWMESMTIEEREELVDTLYEIITSSNAKTIDELDSQKLRSLFHMQKTFRELGIRKQAQFLLSFIKAKNNDEE